VCVCVCGCVRRVGVHDDEWTSSTHCKHATSLERKRGEIKCIRVSNEGVSLINTHTKRDRECVCVCVCVWKRERENLLCSCACISVTCLRVRKGEKWIEFLEGAFAFASAFAFAIHFFVVVVVSMTECASAYKGGQTSLLCIRLLWCKHE